MQAVCVSILIGSHHLPQCKRAIKEYGMYAIDKNKSKVNAKQVECMSRKEEQERALVAR